MYNKVCPYPRGKGLGGSTLINALIYARGHQTDYDQWANLVANQRWNYTNVLNYFKKSERFIPTVPHEPHFHGTEGPLTVKNLPLTPQLSSFLEANEELGFDTVDYNANKLGASPEQVCTSNGRRWDNAKAFLAPVRHRRNLEILTESYVTKVRFDVTKRVATGVEFSHKGKNYFVESKKEVILCGGVFGTAQILMLSGVGPKRHLEKLGIKVLADLEVGSTLRDHPAFWGLLIGTNVTAPVVPLRETVQEFLKGVGPLTVPGGTQGIGMYESSYSRGTGVPDIELLFLPSISPSPLSRRCFGLSDQSFEDLNREQNKGQAFRIYVIDLHSQSVGTVRLKSKNPYDYPLIHSNFLSDGENRDIKTLYEGIQLVLKLLETKVFKAMNATLKGCPLRACRGFDYLSESYWFCALRQLTSNMFHPLGTCPMGKNPKKGVVDSELRVFGFRNLRIADASVFPLTFAGHPNAPVVMIGEQLGDLVKETYR